MRIADSSVLLAMFLTGDVNHAAAMKELSKPAPVMIPSEVLAETLGVLSKRRGIDFARMAKEWLETKPHFQFVFTQRIHYDLAARFFARPPERLDYVDALLVAWKATSGAELITYDEDLRKVAKGT